MKDIQNFKGIYAVTKEGKVWSYPKRGKGRVHNGMYIKPSLAGGGYELIALSGSRVTTSNRNHFVHRLVAQTYLANPNDKEQVNHKDGNKLNNDISNLEWVTCSENSIHAHATGLRKPRILTDKQVHNAYERYINGETQTKIAKEYNVCPSLISYSLRRKAMGQRSNY